MKRLILIGFISSLLYSCSSSTGSSGDKILEKLAYYQPEGYSDSLLVGTYEVFSDRKNKTGRKIPLYVSITPALKQSEKREPIFMIDGGPGVGVSNWSYFYTEEDTLYRAYHDIVYIDARGTGRSEPLHCFELQTKGSLQQHFAHPYPADQLKSCIDRYKDSIDFNHYNTQNIVEDLEEVRRWLGYDKINLYSVSYGGKVALAYMNQFPASIKRAVLHTPSHPELNNHIMRSTWSQEAMDRLFTFCQEDSACDQAFPDLKNEFLALKYRIESDTVVITLDNQVKLKLKWGPIATKLYGMLYVDSEYIRIPYIVHQAFLENYTPLLEEFTIDVEPSLLFADGMFFSVVCSEEINLEWDSTLKYQNTFLADYIYQTRKEACFYWPVDDISRQATLGSDIETETLILSGQFDPVTPPVTGKMVAGQLHNSKQIVIPYMGHMFGDLSNLDCYDKYVVAFFDGAEASLDAGCFNEMKPAPFQVNSSN